MTILRLTKPGILRNKALARIESDAPTDATDELLATAPYFAFMSFATELGVLASTLGQQMTAREWMVYGARGIVLHEQAELQRELGNKP